MLKNMILKHFFNSPFAIDYNKKGLLKMCYKNHVF